MGSRPAQAIRESQRQSADRQSTLRILRETAAGEGSGMLMVTHGPEHAALADRVCFLKNGRIAEEQLDPRTKEAPVATVHERLVTLGI